jgi:hypothetical protein
MTTPTSPASWVAQARAELVGAANARAAGNEGRARVCARRAAGVIAAEYLHGRDLAAHSPSAYDRLRALRALPDLDERALPLVRRLLEPVDFDHRLPEGVDLIADARRLAEILLDWRFEV